MSAGQRYLVVGSGSIARRHIANLKTLFGSAEVACVSASGRALSSDETGAHRIFDQLESALDWDPHFAVVASPAPWHVSHAVTLVGAGIPVLIEKPLSNSLEQFSKGGNLLLAHKSKVQVGYNLRHLSSAVRFKALLDDGLPGRIHCVIVDVGQYLPDWRPGTDYRCNVSAQRKLGGGVLLELSHELDYLVWLFDRFETAYCVASTSGTLDLDVEDRVDAVLSRRDGLVANLHMDFLQRVACRTCKVVGERGNLVWDLARNRIEMQGSSSASECLFSEPEFDRNRMYLAELEQFSQVAAGESEPLIGVEAALYTLRLVDALKRSSAAGQAVLIGESQ
jgi:predicted dehydrogenase